MSGMTRAICLAICSAIRPTSSCLEMESVSLEFFFEPERDFFDFLPEFGEDI
ncbi:hypothetical protein HanPI659440_Chr14g0555171 [Helianthus annuus]|nr:hypothetical protein HanPI659440_Chr14g0555171 [Helianthus annuus]